MAKIIPHAKVCCIIAGFLLLSFHPCVAKGQGRDIQWLRSIYYDRNSSLDGTMKFLSNSYLPVNAAVPLGQLIYGYARHDRNAVIQGWQTAGGFVIAAVLAQGSKYIINRPRPYETYPDIIPYKYDKDGSMPSGHASICFATATSLSLEYPKWYIIAPSYLYACAVSYSRLHLGQHYPGDVVAGALLGAGSSYLSYRGMKWLQQSRSYKKQNMTQPHER